MKPHIRRVLCAFAFLTACAVAACGGGNGNHTTVPLSGNPVASQTASPGDSIYVPASLPPGQPYAVAVFQPSASRVTHSSLRGTLSGPYSSTTIDECFPIQYANCFVQTEADVASSSFTVNCNGNQACTQATWKCSVSIPTGVTATFTPATFMVPNYTNLTMAVPKTQAIGPSTLTVSYTQVAGPQSPPVANISVPMQTLCSIAAATCPKIWLEDNIPSPTVTVAPSPNTAAGWPMQLTIHASPSGYVLSSPSWTLPNSPVASYDAMSGKAPVPLPSQTGIETAVFYWVWPGGWSENAVQAVSASIKLTKTNIEIADPTPYPVAYTVHWPSALNLNYSVGTVQIATMNSGTGLYGIGLGNIYGVNGITWKYQANAPTNVAGNFSLVQLISSQTVVQANASPIPSFAPTTPPVNLVIYGPPANLYNTGSTYWLDGCEIYASALHVSAGGAVTLGAGYDDTPQVPIAKSSDVPRTTYYKYSEVDIKDEFQDYFVFRPDKPPGERPSPPPNLWITIAAQTWDFGGTTTLSPSNTWYSPYWTWVDQPPPAQATTPIAYATTYPSSQTCPTIPPQL